jgi:hypothetical protein
MPESREPGKEAGRVELFGSAGGMLDHLTREKIADIVRRVRIGEIQRRIMPSWNDQLDALAFRRVLPVLLYVDADEDSEELGEEILRSIAEQMSDVGFTTNDILGPRQGPHGSARRWQSLFASCLRRSQ